jgi:hypothetical protein
MDAAAVGLLHIAPMALVALGAAARGELVYPYYTVSDACATRDAWAMFACFAVLAAWLARRGETALAASYAASAAFPAFALPTPIVLHRATFGAAHVAHFVYAAACISSFVRWGARRASVASLAVGAAVMYLAGQATSSAPLILAGCACEWALLHGLPLAHVARVTARDVTPWLIGPVWLLNWATFYALPLALAFYPVMPTPLPWAGAAYTVLTMAQHVVIDAPPEKREDGDDAPALHLVHPHGIVCHGIYALIAQRAPLARRMAPVLVTTVWPLVIALLAQYGWTAASASRASIAAKMRERRDVWLYPGGFREAARHSHARDVVDVGSRGAIRLALENGYRVRVAFAFGERKTAYNVQGPPALWRVRMWLAARGVPAVLPWYVVFGKSPVRVVVSRALEIPEVREPSAAVVEEWHARYVETLRALHAAHKAADDPALVVVGA